MPGPSREQRLSGAQQVGERAVSLPGKTRHGTHTVPGVCRCLPLQAQKQYCARIIGVLANAPEPASPEALLPNLFFQYWYSSPTLNTPFL